MALTSCKPGREEEFHEWYNNYHLPEAVSISCYRSGRRFRLTAISGDDTPWEYLAFYRFVGPAKDMHPTLSEEMKASKWRRAGAVAEGDGAWAYSAL